MKTTKCKVIEFNMEKDDNVIPMVCIYNTENVSESIATACMYQDETNENVLLMSKRQYENVFKPAVEFVGCLENSTPSVVIGDEFFYYDEDDGYEPERCRIDTIIRNTEGDIDSIGITFIDENGNDTDFDEFSVSALQELYKTREDIEQNHPVFGI